MGSPFGTAAHGNGGSDMGDGSGSGESGKGPGAGTSGRGKGKTNAKAVRGTGSDNGTPGSSAPADGKVRADAPGQKQVVLEAPPPPRMEQFAKQLQPTQPRIKTAPTKHTGGTTAGKTGKYGVERKGFYGLEVSGSRKVLFIVDISGSMAAPSLELPQKNRLDVLKLELLRSIDGNIENKSSRSGGFTILAFHSTTEAFPKNRVCRYDDSHGIKKAKKFIDELRPAGGTMMAAAWKLALKLCKKQGIDTVYFMTDGFPGDNFNEKWLAKELKHHRLTELKINCVAVGSDHQFMKNIAQSNHGKYVFIP